MTKKNTAIRTTSSDSIADTANKPNSKLIRSEQRMTFSGPIPHPDILTRYADIIPNGADRILRMAEQQQTHRQHLEKVVIESDARRANLGMFLGFIIALALGLGGIGLIALGRQIDGLAIIFVPLASLAGIFVYTQRARKQQREARSKTASERTPKK